MVTIGAVRRIEMRHIRQWVSAVGGGTINTDSATRLGTSEVRLLAAGALRSALLVALIAVAGDACRNGVAAAPVIYWFLMAALFLPLAYRMLQKDVSRLECIGSVTVAGLSTYVVKLMPDPRMFRMFDEYLHWVTAERIFTDQHLFGTNTLLPISPIYPGLEIITTAFSHLAGTSITTSALVILGCARVVSVAAIFLLIERLAGSHRIAAVAALAYMGNSSFLLFHAQFAYESLAIPLFVLVLFSFTFFSGQGSSEGRAALNVFQTPYLLIAFILFAALAVTHHVTSLMLTAVLFVLAGLEYMPRGSRSATPLTRRASLVLAIACSIFVLFWNYYSASPIYLYLMPMFDSGLQTIYKVLTFKTSGRVPFKGEDGSVQPLALRAIGLIKLLLICGCLAFAFLRLFFTTWAAQKDAMTGGRPFSWVAYDTSMVALVAGLAVLFPATVLLRLSDASWEMGHRLGAFVFIGVAPCIAYTAICIHDRARKTALAAVMATGVLTTCFIGGIITGAADQIVPSPYRVVADAHSLENTGIAAARWTRKWLGCSNRIGADRINRLLSATFGCQTVVTSLYDGIDISSLVHSEDLSEADLGLIRAAHLDYLLVDMRLSTARPLFGVYYERGEAREISVRPMDTHAVAKYSAANGVGRAFDNGIIYIYDLRGSRDVP
jgi:hypothetical protein